MWIFTRYGFYSIACASKPNGSLDSQSVMVRARCIAHLRSLQKRFPSLAVGKILESPNHDYRYRLVIPRASWTTMVGKLAQEQEWSNFKNEATKYQGKSGRGYVAALHEVWGVMHRLQENEERSQQSSPIEIPAKMKDNRNLKGKRRHDKMVQVKQVDPPNTKAERKDVPTERTGKKTIDSGGWFETKNGQPVFARGEHQGMSIGEVAEVAPEYLEEMLTKAPKDAIKVIRGVFGFPVEVAAPAGKFRVMGVDLFSHEDYLVGDYNSRAKAFKAADANNTKRTGSMDDIYYVYDDQGAYIRGNEAVGQKISP